MATRSTEWQELTPVGGDKRLRGLMAAGSKSITLISTGPRGGYGAVSIHADDLPALAAWAKDMVARG